MNWLIYVYLSPYLRKLTDEVAKLLKELIFEYAKFEAEEARLEAMASYCSVRSRQSKPDDDTT